MLSPCAPTTEIKRIDIFRLQPFQQFIGHVHFFNHVVFIDLADMKRIDPGRLAQDTPGGGIQVFNQLGAEGDQSAIGVAIRVQQPLKPIPDADHLPSHSARRQGGAHDYGIYSRNKAGTHIDGNPSVETAMSYFCCHN